jgi:uncharacterized cupin superfamily protein
MTQKQSYLLKASEIAEREATFSHPWNPHSSIVGTRMGSLVGLTRTGVNILAGGHTC